MIENKINPNARTAVSALTGKTSQCGACGEVFSGLTAFDAHRTGKPQDRSCADPAELGMEIKRRGDNGTVWGYPAPENAPDYWRSG